MIPFLKIQKEEIRKILLIISIKLNLYCSQSSEARERAAEAEAALDSATVTTIHGFCSEILRAHPLAAGLPPGFAVDRGLEGRRFAAEEWSAFAEDELGRSGRRAGKE